MTDTLDEAQDLPGTVGRAWFDLRLQIEEGTLRDAESAARWLGAVLAEEDPDLAVDTCLALADWWEELTDDAPEDAAATDPGVSVRLRAAVAALTDVWATRDPASTVLLVILREEDPPRAAEHALAVLAQPDLAPSDPLGDQVIRALMAQVTRQEEAGEKPSLPVVEGLARCLDHPGWLPEGLPRASLAALIAWAYYLRDDYAQLPPFVAAAKETPADDDFTEAMVAMLDVIVSSFSLEPGKVERKLRGVAEAVRRSGDERLITAHRAVSDLMARTRLQRVADPVGEMVRLRPDHADDPGLTDMALLLDAMEQIGRQQVDDTLRERLAAWRESGRPSAMGQVDAAALWTISGLIAVTDRRTDEARAHLLEARRLRALVAAPSPQLDVLDHLLATLDALTDFHDRPDDTVARLRVARDEARAAGHHHLAAVTESQIALAALARRRFTEALVWSVRGYDGLRQAQEHLTGSSERAASFTAFADLRGAMLKAAAHLPDPRLLAELLEFLRAQEAPSADLDPTAEQLPLAAVVPPAVGTPMFFRRAADLSDSVAVGRPAPVLMPWGMIALADFLGDDGTPPVRLTVPR